MWAGGSIAFKRPIPLNNAMFRCTERIADVQVKGQGKDQKVFVKIEREVYPERSPVEQDNTGGIDPLHLVETRTLVFMREDRRKAAAGTTTSSPKVLKPTQTPDFSHTIIPTAPLLFRFSALTFNAHAIHLDKQYCRDIEGHRNLLVHGPLSLVLMLQILDDHLRVAGGEGGREVIRAVEYRNLAPLYAEEEMKVCIKRKEKVADSGSWDVWIEGRDGGYGVKGTVRTAWLPQKVRPAEVGNIVQDGVKEGDPVSPKENIDLETKSASAAETAIEDETIPYNRPAPSKNRASEVERSPEEGAEEENAPYFQR
jgi:hydroxyacyl-ACP dehydratase HTD2-like protein with hotdog domain